MLEKVAGQLVVYGPLGVISVLCLLALFALFRIREKQIEGFHKQIQDLRDFHAKQLAEHHEEHDKQLKELRDQHAVEMKTLMERHITKAENWNEKWSDLSTKLHTVLESLVKRRQG